MKRTVCVRLTKDEATRMRQAVSHRIKHEFHPRDSVVLDVLDPLRDALLDTQIVAGARKPASLCMPATLFAALRKTVEDAPMDSAQQRKALFLRLKQAKDE